MRLTRALVLGAASGATAVTLTPTTVRGGGCPTRTVFVPTVSTKTDTVTKTVTTCKPVPTDCPTLTATATACRTCFLPGCTEVVSTTKSCGCPTAVPTKTLAFPCGEPDVCNKIGCTTRYVVETEAC